MVLQARIGMPDFLPVWEDPANKKGKIWKQSN
jgi:hypothetical protein